MLILLLIIFNRHGFLGWFASLTLGLGLRSNDWLLVDLFVVGHDGLSGSLASLVVVGGGGGGLLLATGLGAGGGVGGLGAVGGVVAGVVGGGLVEGGASIFAELFDALLDCADGAVGA